MSDRDLSVEKWLRQIPAADGAAEDCLDAESLASWVDGSLDGTARAAAEAHASNCARCQSMLAAMVQTLPAAAPAPERSPVRKWLMMLGPALGAAAAVALWFAVDQRPSDVASRLEQEVASGASASPSADEPAKEAAAAPSGERDRVVPPQAAPVESPAKVLADAKAKDAQPQADADALSKRQRTSPDLEAREAGRRLQMGETKKAEPQDAFAAARPSATQPLAPPPMPAAAPPVPAAPTRNAADSRTDQVNAGAIQALPSPNQNQVAINQYELNRVNQSQANQGRGSQATQASAEAQRRAESVGGVAETVTVTAKSPMVQTSASSTNISQLRAKDLGIIGNFVESAQGQARWRIASGRVIERSIDDGKTWSAQHLMPTANLIVAGASPTPSVCWLVGRGGLVLRTTDARVWQTVKFPESVDLINVTAADALVATVTTSDGRFFTTSDGGVTWVKQ
jgi:hypothetical protein